MTSAAWAQRKLLSDRALRSAPSAREYMARCTARNARPATACSCRWSDDLLRAASTRERAALADLRLSCCAQLRPLSSCTQIRCRHSAEPRRPSGREARTVVQRRFLTTRTGRTTRASRRCRTHPDDGLRCTTSCRPPGRPSPSHSSRSRRCRTSRSATAVDSPDDNRVLLRSRCVRWCSEPGCRPEPHASKS